MYNQKYTNLTNTVYNGVNALRVAVGAGDPNIKPETQTEIEGSFDASAFGGRASLSMTVFDKSIDDLIIQPTFAPSSISPRSRRSRSRSWTRAAATDTGYRLLGLVISDRTLGMPL